MATKPKPAASAAAASLPAVLTVGEVETFIRRFEELERQVKAKKVTAKELLGSQEFLDGLRAAGLGAAAKAAKKDPEGTFAAMKAEVEGLKAQVASFEESLAQTKDDVGVLAAGAEGALAILEKKTGFWPVVQVSRFAEWAAPESRAWQITIQVAAWVVISLTLLEGVGLLVGRPMMRPSHWVMRGLGKGPYNLALEDLPLLD